ncbi:high-affinity nicotinic acid transporter [Fusarium mundagurra]|uniref:High-affinity nicotinic acid transporter n=1 Tax=Fusarium mundagurra TaxID=1567541 RepID=A0A8H5YB95_9HYPO|nr:high-affinity nicotinic acid transporter [Fusarium mundagurra]
MAGNKPTSAPADEIELVKRQEQEAMPNAYHDVSDEYPTKKRKKVLFKMDLHIIPLFMILYLLSYIDRANIGNAKIEGIEADLGLTSKQYQITLSIFFVSYILCEVPSNWILEELFSQRPSLYIGIITVLWGILMTLHGIVKDFDGIVTVRFIMGIFEAGFFPGAIAVLNKWYTKYELATRLALFYTASALSGAFSGLLAYAIAKMDGVAGVITPFLLPDTPERRPSWLTDEECDYLIRRMVAQNGGERADEEGQKLTLALIKDVVTDWQYYPLILCYWSSTVPIYGMKFTLPQIIKNMGYSSSSAQLLSIPPYVAGAISSVGFNMLGDKMRRRSYFLLIPQVLVVISYCIITPLSSHINDHIGACFFAVILLNIGVYLINPGTSSWASNNSAGAAKRSVALAYVLSIASIGGIFASYIFIDSEAPGYPTGFGVSMAAAIAGIFSVAFLEFYYKRINKKRDQMSIEEISEKYSEEDLARLGNRSPLFRYTR